MVIGEAYWYDVERTDCEYCVVGVCGACCGLVWEWRCWAASVDYCCGMCDEFGERFRCAAV